MSRFSVARRKKVVSLKRRHNGIGITLMPPLLDSLSKAYAVTVAMEAETGVKAIDGRPFSLVLWPDQARHLAEQLVHFATQAETASEKGA